MTSIANFLRGTGKEFFDLFERAGQNLAHAAQLLDEMLAEYPERRGLAQDILSCERDGDQITLDVLNRSLEVEMGDDWESRKDGWEPLPPKYPTGVLAKYRKLVSSAADGAVTG